MSEFFPDMNQLRFHELGKEIDYITNLPSFDLMFPRIIYQRGEFATDYYPVYQLNASLETQVLVVRDNVISAGLYNEDGSLADGDEYTDVREADNFATIINIQAETLGLHYITLVLKINNVNVTFISELFNVVNWADKQDLIKIKYSDNNNLNGRFYLESGESIWYAIAYYTGKIDVEQPQLDRSVFTSQQNNLKVIRSTVRLVDKLFISCIHRLYYANLAAQLSCNEIYINDVSYSVESFGKLDKKDDNVDVGDVEIIISRNNNNN